MIKNLRFRKRILKKKYRYEKGFLQTEINFTLSLLDKYDDHWDRNTITKTIPKKYWGLIQEKYQYFQKINKEYEEIKYEEKEQVKLLLQIIPILIDVDKKFNYFEKMFYLLNDKVLLLILSFKRKVLKTE